MAENFTVRLVGGKELQRRLDQMTPEQNRRIVAPALLESMLRTLSNAAQKQIIRGGAKGAPAHPQRLTSRSGLLRRSLTSSFALDKSKLPRSIAGGSNVVYAGVHEFGSPKQGLRKRAYLAPALVDEQRNFEGIFLKHWKKAAQL